jgi:hypothetical protein
MSSVISKSYDLSKYFLEPPAAFVTKAPSRAAKCTIVLTEIILGVPETSRGDFTSKVSDAGKMIIFAIVILLTREKLSAL